jgi:hypothetical protein
MNYNKQLTPTRQWDKKLKYDHAKAKKNIWFIATNPNTGTIVELENMSDVHRASAIETTRPILPLISQGPHTYCYGYLVCNTACRIIEVRNETRWTENGIALGDRSFLRCYQQAERDYMQYILASDTLQREADKTHYAGVKVVFDGVESRGGHRYPKLRKCGANEHADAILRSPEYAAQKAFECMNDKHWHRWLFPYACFFYEKVPNTHQCWTDWKDTLLTGRSNQHYINPYSVADVDVRHLVNYPGYLDRYMFNMSIVTQLMVRFHFNVLQCYRLPGCPCGDHTFRRFLTLERYFYVFGSIQMHNKCTWGTYADSAGPWTEIKKRFSDAETFIKGQFQIGSKQYQELLLFVVQKVRSASMLQSVFPRAHLQGETIP